MKKLLLIWNIMRNETHKRLLILWDYKFNTLMQLCVIALVFIGATFFLHTSASQLPAVLLGYILWIYARLIIITTGTDMMSEAQAGTLEQMYMSPLSTELLLLGRMVALLISTTLMVLLVILPLMLLMHIILPFNWAFLPVLLLALLGLFGFTLFLNGLVLLFKQIEALADIVQNLLLFLAGTIMPISVFPAWLAIVARTLPTTQGILVLHELTQHGVSLATTWQNGELGLLLLHSLLYLVGGWLIFKACERVARRQGSLGQY